MRSMLPRLAVLLAFCLTVMGQTPSSDATSQAPVKKIIIEEDEPPPSSAKVRNKGQGSSSPAHAAQSPAPSELKKDNQPAPPEPDHSAQPVAPAQQPVAPAVSVAPAQQPVAPASSRTSNPERIGRPLDRWLQPYVFLAALLAVIGLGALAIAFRQLLEMKHAR